MRSSTSLEGGNFRRIASLEIPTKILIKIFTIREIATGASYSCSLKSCLSFKCFILY